MSVGQMMEYNHKISIHRCDECQILIDPRHDEPHEVMHDGESIVVCDSCRADNYNVCNGCTETHHDSDGKQMGDGEWYCKKCMGERWLTA